MTIGVAEPSGTQRDGVTSALSSLELRTVQFRREVRPLLRALLRRVQGFEAGEAPCAFLPVELAQIEPLAPDGRPYSFDHDLSGVELLTFSPLVRRLVTHLGRHGGAALVVPERARDLRALGFLIEETCRHEGARVLSAGDQDGAEGWYCAERRIAQVARLGWPGAAELLTVWRLIDLHEGTPSALVSLLPLVLSPASPPGTVRPA